jgi:hypothetical protein
MEKRVLVFFVLLFIIPVISAEQIGIEINNTYSQTGSVSFQIIIYSDDGNRAEGMVDYVIRDYYTEIIEEGRAESGERIYFQLPKNAVQGPWEISASYNGTSARELFNVGDYKKIGVKLEEDRLIIENIGNVDYDKRILVTIGDQDETAQIYLSAGQTKEIRLSAPDGEYDVRVDTGEEDELVFSDVALTGNVIGLERISEKGFFSRFPLVSLFLIAIAGLVIIVFGMRFFKRQS